MDNRILLAVLFSALLLSFISCETQQSEPDVEPQQTSVNAAVMDTSNMEMIDGVPVIPTPGSQINKDKVLEALEEANTSYSDILEAREEDDIEKNIDHLEQLLQRDRLRNDEELQFMVHNLLGSSYLKKYEYTDQNSDLDQAEEHLNSAISLLENQPQYKADLADAYTSRIAVYSLQEKYDQALSLRKYLIEEFQDIGYGFYKNWFASRQVEALYNWVKMDSLESGKNQEIIDYLSDVADKYDNEVGITARMVLARHYAKGDQQDKADALTESIEQQLASSDNPEFKEDKWLQFKTEIGSIQKRKTESVSPDERDTLFYEINSDMIAQEEIVKSERQNTEYRIHIHLKKEYRPEFAEMTADNIGNFLAVIHEGEILSPALPTIQIRIPDGRFIIGPFKEEAKAQAVIQKILGKDK